MSKCSRPSMNAPRLIFLLILFLNFRDTGFAQSQISEPLSNAFGKKLRPANRIKITSREQRNLLFFASDYVTLADTEFIRELDVLANTLDVGVKADDKRTLIYNANAIGSYLDFRYPGSGGGEAIPYFRKVVELAGMDTAYLVKVARAYWKIGEYYEETDRFEDAADYYAEGLKIALKSDDTANIYNAYLALANLYKGMDVFDKWLYYDRASFNYLTKEDYESGLVADNEVAFNHQKAFMYIALYTKYRSVYFLDSAFKCARSIPHGPSSKKKWHDTYGYTLATCYYHAGDYQMAIAYVDSDLKYYRYYEELIPSQICVKAMSLMKMGCGKEAASLLMSNPEIYADRGTAKMAYYTLLAYAKERHDWKLAFDYLEKLIPLEDSTNIEGRRKQVFGINQKYAVKEKEAKIDRLELINEGSVRQRNIILLIATSIALLLVLIIYIIVKKRQVDRLKAIHDINTEKQKIKEIILNQDKKVEEIREKTIAEQRQLISQDMHDELSSALTGLKFYVSDLRLRTNNDHEQQTLRDIEEEVKGVYMQAREYMHNLRQGLETAIADLPGFLQSLSEQFNDSSSFRIRLFVEIHEIEAHLSQEQQFHLDHIFKEAITNTMKHTQATEIALKISFDATKCYFSISDNGQGISALAVKGIGVEGMQARMEQLHGSITTNSSPEGTKLEGVFPLAIA